MDAVSIWMEQFSPPPFVTTLVAAARHSSPSKRKKSIGIGDGTWWSLKNLKYEASCGILANEFTLLRQFIKRKGSQLRLEKAMMRSKEIDKLAKRWKANKFYAELMKFKDAFPEGQDEARLPSYQWLQWIIYVLVREAALLAQIKHKCETTMEFWFGLISASHHWGDSLIISSIIARVWHISSVMVEELDSTIYPFIVHLADFIEPVPGSLLWPNNASCLEIPKIRLTELLLSLDIKFQPANLNRTLSTVVAKDSGWILRVLDDDGENFVNVDVDVEVGGKLPEPDSSIEGSLAKYVQDEEDSDTGVPVQPVSSSAKTKIAVSVKNVSQFRKYWKQFFDQCSEKFLQTESGRAEMLQRIIGYKSSPKNMFKPPYRRMCSEVRPTLVEWEDVIKRYERGSMTEPQFRKKSKLLCKKIKDQVKQLAETRQAKINEIRRKKAKAEKKPKNKKAKPTKPKAKSKVKVKAKNTKKGRKKKPKT